LPGLHRPGIMGLDNPIFRQALATPQYGFWSEPQEEESQTGIQPALGSQPSAISDQSAPQNPPTGPD